MTAETPAADYPTLFRRSADFLSLVEFLHPRAVRGDAAAQYWMQAAIQYCDPNFEITFRNFNAGTTEFTVEEVLEREHRLSNDYYDERDVRLLLAQCGPLYRHGWEIFGDADEWLEKSAQAGYPYAQAQLADDLAHMAAGETTELAAQQRARSQQLAIDALRTGNADIVMLVSRLAWFQNYDHAHELDSGASRAYDSWRLAACQRGADCSQNTEWARRWCRNDPACQPFETAVDMFRRRYGIAFDALDMRAREINELIDAKRWDELEFR